MLQFGLRYDYMYESPKLDFDSVTENPDSANYAGPTEYTGADHLLYRCYLATSSFNLGTVVLDDYCKYELAVAEDYVTYRCYLPASSFSLGSVVLDD